MGQAFNSKVKLVMQTIGMEKGKSVPKKLIFNSTKIWSQYNSNLIRFRQILINVFWGKGGSILKFSKNKQ